MLFKMSSLFSMFDPSSLFSLHLNWMSSGLSVLLLPSTFWIMKNQFLKAWCLLFKFIDSEFKAILGGVVNPGSTWITLSMFVFIFTINFSGLLPYVFPASSHLTFSVSVALPLWLGHMGMSWVFQPNHMLAHLVPLGTPGALMPFMVLIEIISSVIRPFTLSVRLAANIIAGHLLLTLLGGQAEHSSMSVLVFLISALVVLNILESAVAVIQAYVFSVLSTLYISEVQSLTLINS